MAYKSLMLVMAGLILFLYALNHLSEALKSVAGDRMKEVLNRFTRNVFAGILTGLIVTTLLDSSSAVIIMTIALVNARLMTFRQAMGVVMGANIGTTISSQIIALNIGEYAAVPIAAGFLMMMLSRNQLAREAGRIIFSFGLIFFGLFTIEEAVLPLKNSETFTQWMQQLDQPVKGMFTGALVTLIIQSSSATVGMAIGLSSQSLLSLAAGIAIMLGAELGTCSDTLIASVGRSRSALRTGVFHLLFNVITIIVGLIVLPYFTQLVNALSGTADVARKIANAHMLFNTLGVILLVPFVAQMEKLLYLMIPLRSNELESSLVPATADKPVGQGAS